MDICRINSNSGPDAMEKTPIRMPMDDAGLKLLQRSQGLKFAQTFCLRETFAALD
jgi:hypothetical protein